MDWYDVADLSVRFPLVDFWLPDIAFLRAFGPFAATVEWDRAADLVGRSAVIAGCLPATGCFLAFAAFLTTLGLITKGDGGRMPRIFASIGLSVVVLVHGSLLIGVWHGIFVIPPGYWRPSLLCLTAYVVFASVCVLSSRGRMENSLNLSHESCDGCATDRLGEMSRPGDGVARHRRFAR